VVTGTAAVIGAGALVGAGAGDGERVQIAPAFDMTSLDPEAMQERALRSTMPDEHHEMMKRMAGEWDVRLEVSPPGVPKPIVSRLTATVTPALGGRYMKEEIRGEFMGQPFESIGMFGYDTFDEKYHYTAFTNQSTASMRFEGYASQDGKTLTMYGEMDEPSLNVQDRMVKTVSYSPDEDTAILEVHDMHIGGDDTLVLRWVYTRAE
jgi:hypothetical protein